MRLLRDGGKVLALAYRRAAGKTGSDVGLIVRAAAGAVHASGSMTLAE